VDPGIWEEAVRKNTHKKAIESCNRNKRRVCTKERESVPIIKGKERGGMQVHQ